MKHLKLFLAGIALLMQGVLNAAEIWVDFNETTFPDAEFRTWLQGRHSDTAGANQVTIKDGQIRVDRVTTISVPTATTDLTGIKYFENLTTLYASPATTKGLKLIDVSGLSKLSTIQVSPQGNSGDGSFSGTGNKGVILETLIADGTAVSTLYLQRLPKLKHLSVKNCAKLSAVYAHNCDLMGLDLSTCPAITTVKVENNPNMSWLRFSPDAKGLKMIHACDCNINELIFPTTITATTFSGLNIDGNPIAELDLTPFTGKTISGFIFRDTALKSLPLFKNNIYGAGTWADATNKCNLNVGHLSSFNIHKPGELGTGESVSAVKGGTYDSASGVFTFDEGVYQASYTFKSYNKSYKAYTFNVTVTREPEPFKLYIEMLPALPGRAAVAAAETAEETQLPRYEVPYIGDNTYQLDIKHIDGNFQLVQVNSDGSEVKLGGNSSQLTYHANGLDRGYVNVQHSNSYAIHREQTETPPANADKVSRSPQPHFYYTTHPDEANNDLLGIDNTKMTVRYVNGAPAGTMTLSEGTTTGIEDITTDAEMEETEAEVEWYTIQGVRVSGDNLTPGIYIRRQGSMTSKIMVR